ncbi:MAG: NAD(P)H-hydrate dehydratase [Nitrospirae bacterium]|nr:NAD(P)H-hydrate dehydratase [Nitrospirota bacterium]
MKIVTSAEIREIDRVTIEELGIQSLVLMERAGVIAASHISKKYLQQKTIVLCGGGNNGGDGLVIARELCNYGFDVKVILLSPLDRLSPDCHSQYIIARNFGIDIVVKTTIDDLDIKNALIIDALIGTGLNKPIKDGLLLVIEMINHCNDVVSIDIPSGISADTGQMLGAAVIAKMTITFGLPKIGHLIFPGREHCGELIVENIGFPKRFLETDKIKCELIEKDYIKSIIPKRTINSNKGNYGHALIIGGTSGKTGAVIMASRASLKSGSGLVTIGVPNSLVNVYQGNVVEQMVLPLRDNGNGGFSKDCLDQIFEFIDRSGDVIVIGPGMGVDEQTIEIVTTLIRKSTIPLLIDAGGLNCISTLKYEERLELLNSAKIPLILTPHTGEMARLLSKDNGDFKSLCAKVEAERLDISRKFSKDSGAILVLKGASTIISTPNGNSYINITGNPGMATAGSGDVLAGMIASFLGQRVSPVEAAQIGVYLHGISGDIASEVKSMYSMTATDLIENIFMAINKT